MIFCLNEELYVGVISFCAFSFSSSGRTSLLNPNAEPFPAPPSDEVKEVMLDLSENRAFALETKEDDKALKRRRVKNLFPLSVALVSKFALALDYCVYVAGQFISSM